MKPSIRKIFLFAIPIFLLNLGIYLAYLPDQMNWAHFGNDGGDYLAAILTRGVPHPTGYPTYILLNFLFQLLPYSTPYWRGAFFSACMAALSSALLYTWLVRHLTKRHPAALSGLIAGVATLAWAVSPFLFSEAVIVDVHSLHGVFLILGLFWVDSLSSISPVKPFQLSECLLPFLFGLGLGNHITLVLFLPAVIYTGLSSVPRELRPRLLVSQFTAFALGLLVYLYLPWSAAKGPAVNWGNPQTLEGFAWLISGSAYHGMLLSVPSTEFFPRLAQAARLLIDQFGILGVAAGVLGALSPIIYPRTVRLSLAWGTLVYSLFALTYAALDWTTYLLPLLVIWCAWIAAGLAVLTSWRWRGQAARVNVGLLAALLLAGALLGQLPGTLRRGDPRSDSGAFDYVQSLFAQAPSRAIILTSADLDTFPLWYYHLGLKQRPDLHIVVSPLTVFAWYRDTIQHTYPDLAIPSLDPPQDSAWEILLTNANPGLPVCVTSVSAPPQTGVHFKCKP